jgi:L-lactate dehydrogenase complex protein LldG
MVEAARAMSEARDEILASIRSASRLAPEPVPRSYRREGALDADALVELFARRVADYRADVRVVAPADAPASIAAACGGARRIGVPPGLPEEWRPQLPEVVEDTGLGARELDELDAVVTGSTVAIAETGTIVLSGGPAEGRRALTLVPDLHVCVVGREQIVELVPEAMEALEPLVRERRPLTFVSGPSATSDIELSRVEGVHGPRTLVVIILKEKSP